MAGCVMPTRCAARVTLRSPSRACSGTSRLRSTPANAERFPVAAPPSVAGPTVFAVNVRDAQRSAYRAGP